MEETSKVGPAPLNSVVATHLRSVCYCLPSPISFTGTSAVFPVPIFGLIS